MSSQILHIFVFSTIFYFIFILPIDATKYSASGTIFCHQNEPMKGALVEFLEADCKPLITVLFCLNPKKLKNSIEIWALETQKTLIIAQKAKIYFPIILGPDRDDYLDHIFTDSNGTFSVSGHESEINNEEPYLLITHQCADPPFIVS